MATLSRRRENSNRTERQGHSPYPNGKLWAPNGIFLHGAMPEPIHWLVAGIPAPPTSESWIRGDIIINDAPKDGGFGAGSPQRTENLELGIVWARSAQPRSIRSPGPAIRSITSNLKCTSSAALRHKCKFAPKMQETITHGARCTKLVRHRCCGGDRRWCTSSSLPNPRGIFVQTTSKPPARPMVGFHAPRHLLLLVSSKTLENR